MIDSGNAPDVDAPVTDAEDVVTTDESTDERDVANDAPDVDAPDESPPPLTVTLNSFNLAGGPVAIVLEHTGPFLLTPPYVEGTRMCWPLDKWLAPPAVAAVLLDPETHRVLGARWRAWQEGDEPGPETAAQMAAQSPAAKRARRCCGK